MTTRTRPLRTGARRRWIALAAGLVVFAILIGLGTWQVQRLHWKEALIAQIDERTHSQPVGIADIEAMGEREGSLEYTPVNVHGRFLNDREMFFFATSEGQSGWYVYTPLVLADDESQAAGDTVIVNRGFVPYDLRDAARRPGSQPEGDVTVTGLVRERLDGKPSFIVPDNKPEERTFFWKDWSTMASISGLDPAETVPFFIDAEKGGDPSVLPVGGVTIIDLPNNHLQYVVTWYGLAAALAAVLAVTLWRDERH